MTRNQTMVAPATERTSPPIPPAKQPDTEAPIHPLLAGRWSPRAFTDEPVSSKALTSLIEAARWAPSSFNEQPWRFVVGRRGDRTHGHLVEILFDGNATWASEAPVLMLSVAKTTFDRNGEPNRHAFHDVGLAVAQLTVQATALGLAVHQMGGFDNEAAREQLGLPAGFEPVAALAIGRPGTPEALPEALAEQERAPRERLATDELVHGARWGQPAAALDGSQR